MSVSIGPFGFSISHLIFFISVACTFLVGYLLTRKNKKPLSDYIFRVIAVTLIAARVGYVIQYWQQYQNEWWQILNVRDGGFNLIAGFSFGILMLAWESWKHKERSKQLLVSCVLGATCFFTSHFVYQSWYFNPPDMPAMTLQSYAGDSVLLTEQYLGNPTVFNLWASWCGPCVKEMPILEDAQNRQQDVAIVIVNQGENREAIQQFLNEQNLQFTHNLLDVRSQFSTQLDTYVLPTTLFFNSEGALVDSHIGELSPARLEQGMRRAREVNSAPE
ncbi:MULTISPECIES: TlpA disulfide reductase family protein [Gammaproteobacteria]|uniref:TlpA disulfide reductase family protein n=1 Tax=Gammaproteobacteria TaxID=1236 RepID=UPI000DD07405|nr:MULTISPECIES: TlpA disulfide reductase family protein [Gammaproteobacteria]RTE87053.1 TlpA family protein disulfide reductase [Aliidiomarina sp. B3213]TCZ93157.1 TlpA family protein disulfide reductase [Lysobacter sp. N42]